MNIQIKESDKLFIDHFIIENNRLFSKEIGRYVFLTDILERNLDFYDIITEPCSNWGHEYGGIIYENDVVKRGDSLYVVKFDSFSHHFCLGAHIPLNKKSNKYDADVISKVKDEITQKCSTNSYLTESSAKKLKKICPARIFNQESLDFAKSLR